MNKSMTIGITLGVATVAVGVGVAFNFMGSSSDAVYSPSVFDDQQYKVSQQQNQNYGYSQKTADGSTIHRTAEISGRQLRDYENTYTQETTSRGETGSIRRVAQIDGKSGGGGYSSDIAVGTEADIQKQLTDMERMSAEAQKMAKMNQAKPEKSGGMIAKLKSSVGNIFGGKGGSNTSSSGGSVGGTAGSAPSKSQQAMMDANLKNIENVSKNLNTKRGRTGSFSQQGSSTSDGPSNLGQSQDQSNYKGTTDLKMVRELSAKAASKDKKDLSSSAGLDPFMGTGDTGGVSVGGDLSYSSSDQVLESIDEDLFATVDEKVEDLESQEDEMNKARKKHKTNCILFAIGALAAIALLWKVGPKLRNIAKGLSPNGMGPPRIVPPWVKIACYVAIALMILAVLLMISKLVKEATLLGQYAAAGSGLFMMLSGLFSMGLMLVVTEVLLNIKGFAGKIVAALGTFITDITKGAAQTSAGQEIAESNKPDDESGG